MTGLKRRICCGLLAVVFLFAIDVGCRQARAGGLIVPLAQAAPAPAPLPSNVQKQSRMYVMEGIVVVLLFGGAIFAVCRSSGRS